MKKLILILAIVMLTAIPALAADVTVSWTNPGDSRVTGYNIYVDPVLANIGADVDATINDPAITTATIPGLTDGQTYYFGATSFAADGTESAMSDIIMYTVQPASRVIEIPGRPQTLTIQFGE